MTTPSEIEQVKQDLCKLRQRIEDIATAGNHTRAEVEATTEMVRDHHLWFVQGRGFRKTERTPQLKSNIPFES